MAASSPADGGAPDANEIPTERGSAMRKTENPDNRFGIMLLLCFITALQPKTDAKYNKVRIEIQFTSKNDLNFEREK
jgi:hypothetical protein